ncbi:MAG: M23 family metallopeptidase [Rikenellaceae bacterium]|nr:M23 family metallopeptidase [Rikenellaceae bacterium]
MGFFEKVGRFFADFRSRYRISVRNPHNDNELFYVYVSALEIVSGAVAFLILLFVGVVTAVAYTPVMDYIPGYQGSRSRAALIENNMRLDSLEHELNLWNNYYENLVRIMDGKAPLSLGISAPDTLRTAEKPVGRIAEDSVLRAQMEADGPYKLQPAQGRGAGIANLMPPVNGVVIEKFSLREGRQAITIAAASGRPVMAVMDGTVVLASSSDEGPTIYLSHHGNLISAYSHNGRLAKRRGDYVKAGEVIAFTGASEGTNEEEGFIKFQLWSNGTPVDPENYIVF